TKERVALDRNEADRGVGVVAQRLEPFLGQRVDGALTGLPRLLACLQVSELGQSFRLDVVLALTRPGEEAATPCHPQQVVCACASLPDKAEDLVREQAQLST